jgi:hypothetical protein
MLPSHDSIILSIANSVRLHAIPIPLPKHTPPYPNAITGVDWGKIQRLKGTFGDAASFQQA